jgi:hypothetical protein
VDNDRPPEGGVSFSGGSINGAAVQRALVAAGIGSKTSSSM